METLTSIFSSGGLSSGRIGFYITLLALVVYIGYDTYHNGHLDPMLAGILAGQGTGGFALTKSGEKVTLQGAPSVS